MQVIATLLPDVAAVPSDVKQTDMAPDASFSNSLAHAKEHLDTQNGEDSKKHNNAQQSALASELTDKEFKEHDTLPEGEQFVSFLEKSRNFRAVLNQLSVNEHNNIQFFKQDRQVPISPVTDAEWSASPTDIPEVSVDIDGTLVDGRLKYASMLVESHHDTPIEPVDDQLPVVPIDSIKQDILPSAEGDKTLSLSSQLVLDAGDDMLPSYNSFPLDSAQKISSTSPLEQPLSVKSETFFEAISITIVDTESSEMDAPIATNDLIEVQTQAEDGVLLPRITASEEEVSALHNEQLKRETASTSEKMPSVLPSGSVGNPNSVTLNLGENTLDFVSQPLHIESSNDNASLQRDSVVSFLQGLLQDASMPTSLKKSVKDKVVNIVDSALSSLSAGTPSDTVMERTLQLLQAEAVPLRIKEAAEWFVSTKNTQESSFTSLQMQQPGENIKVSALLNDTIMVEQASAKADVSKQQQVQAQVEQAINILKPEGQQQLAEKIRWMVNGRQSQAEIRLDPPEMGSMQVRVNVSGDSASVSIVVQNAQARELLGESMTRLRELLSEQGLQLGESFVRQGDDREKQGRQFGSFGSAGVGSDDDDSLLANVIEQPLTRQGLGGIDAYA